MGQSFKDGERSKKKIKVGVEEFRATISDEVLHFYSACIMSDQFQMRDSSV